MDWAKLASYVSSAAGSILGILVITHNIGDQQAQTYAVSIAAVLSAIAAVLSANTKSGVGFLGLQRKE